MLYLKNVRSDRANITTAEIGTPDNLLTNFEAKVKDVRRLVDLSWNASGILIPFIITVK